MIGARYGGCREEKLWRHSPAVTAMMVDDTEKIFKDGPQQKQQLI